MNDDNAIPFLFEYGKKNKENKVRIITNYGNIDIELFNNTPYHRANFIYLTSKKYFEGEFFHRVVKDFIIQGGILIILVHQKKEEKLEDIFYLQTLKKVINITEE